MLRQAISRALAGEGGFRLFVQGEAAVPLPMADLSGFAGCLVLWPMENSAPAIWQLLSALEAGIVPLLLPPGQAPSRLAALQVRFPGFGLRDGDVIRWPQCPVHAAQDLYFGLLTSGSTGEPKAIVTSCERLTQAVHAIHHAQGLESVASSGVLLPLAYSFACVNQLFWAVLHGRALHLPGVLADMAGCLERLRAHEVETLCLVAHQARTLARLGETAAPLPAVRCVNFAGAPFPTGEFDALRRLFPRARLLNNYGCAEAMPRLACTEVLDQNATQSFVGRPVGDIAIRIRDGAIEFQGSSAALGTIHADGSVHAFGDWIASGDLGRLDEAGLHVLGRHDQVVKIGGERLSLLELEQAFIDFGAEHAAVWLDTGEHIVALVQLAPPDLRQLLPWLRARLPRALLPGTIYVTAQWALNTNGKTDRPALQALARSGQLRRIWPAGN
jgi:acyl-coenzyme A synthetase/AMP-(fatty) acid ligase